MRQVIYTSAAAQPFTPAQLVELLRRARVKNAGLGVSGLLLYHGGSFLQVLEGPDEAVRGLAKVIAADPRHRSFKTLFDRPTTDRMFAGWAMGFANGAAGAFAPVAGQLDYLTGLNAAAGMEGEKVVRWVLDLFRAGKLRQAVQTTDSPALA